MSIIKADGTNPFDGIKPDFKVFGVEFTQAWQLLLAGLWGLAFVAVAAYAIFAAIRFAGARKDGQMHGVADAQQGLKNAGIALLILALLPVIFAAILAATK